MSILDEFHEMMRSPSGRLSKTRIIMLGDILGRLADELDDYGQSDAADMVRHWRSGGDYEEEQDDIAAQAWADVRESEVEA